MDMQPDVLVLLAKAVKAGMGVLWERVFLFVGMLIAGVFFGWAMADPDYLRLGAACAFTVLVYWPLVMLERKRHTGVETSSK